MFRQIYHPKYLIQNFKIPWTKLYNPKNLSYCSKAQLLNKHTQNCFMMRNRESSMQQSTYPKAIQIWCSWKRWQAKHTKEAPIKYLDKHLWTVYLTMNYNWKVLELLLYQDLPSQGKHALFLSFCSFSTLPKKKDWF